MSSQFSSEYVHFAQQEAQHWQGLKSSSWADHWERAADRYGSNDVVVEVGGATFTYQELDHLADRFAQWALATQQTHIGVRLANGANFLAAVLGLAKAGITAVLLPDLDPPALSAVTAQSCGVTWVISELEIPGLQCHAPPSVTEGPWPGRISTPDRAGNETAVVIFTSGTSGRRKAALFSHRRLIGAGFAWSLRAHLTSSDHCYITLPLFHGNGLAVAFASCVEAGATAIIRRRFSPRALLDDLRQYRCTAMVYIGELWQLMDQQPRHKNDQENPLRVIFGNGLPAGLWETTTRRFAISRVVEHYGATEMPAGALTNWTGEPGYCGFIPPGHRDENGVLIVDETGAPVVPGESGELLLRVPDDRYRGYLDPALDQEKVWKDLLSENDLWWRSGDHLRRNSDGFFSFVDRVGDSFRWKGENIPTAEVEEAIRLTGMVNEIVLVGVPVPHHFGKAGLASLLPGESAVDVAELLRVLRARVPPYAIPCFLVMQSQRHELTPTLKIRRNELSAAGWSRAQFVLHGGQYIPFSDALKTGLLQGHGAPDFRTT